MAKPRMARSAKIAELNLTRRLAGRLPVFQPGGRDLNHQVWGFAKETTTGLLTEAHIGR